MVKLKGQRICFAAQVTCKATKLLLSNFRDVDAFTFSKPRDSFLLVDLW